LLEASGDVAGALATVAGLWDQSVRSGAVVECPVLGADLVRLAIAVGDAARAAKVAAVVAEVAAEVDAAGDAPSLAGAALHCRGLAHDEVGLLAEAVQACSRAPRPLELAVAAGRRGPGYGAARSARPCPRSSPPRRSGSRPAADRPVNRVGHLADVPRRGRLSRTTACGPGSA
jgi:hypothetical protein